MKSTKYFFLLALLICIMPGCNSKKSEGYTIKRMEWKIELQFLLSEFGHRNWILIVDKAFPAMNTEGIVSIDTKENLLNVLSYTIHQIDSSSHIKPIVYTDKELQFISNEQVANIDIYRSSLSETIEKYNSQTLLHDSVFVKIDNASKLFKVLVLKTNETIPYSSVFIQLDCKYWSHEKEKSMRQTMKK
jgi:D-ribose pyranose/furanose isomerase RbsD